MKDENVDPDPCHGNPKNSCPVDGKCGTKGIIYQATVTTQHGAVSKYVGLSSNKFIQRYQQHTSNFRNLNQKSQTTLSTEVRKLIRENINFELQWRILQTSHPYIGGGNKCSLCLAEIYWIIFKPAESTLNSRQEFMSKCRHQKKYLLSQN